MLGSSKIRGGRPLLFLRHAIVIAVVLLIAACSGGGCSSCSGCGMTPLTRPISAADTIDNAGSIRLTKSGLNFLASAAPSLAAKFLGSTTGEYQYPLSISATTVSIPVIGDINVSFCPGHPNPGSTPEQCELDVLLRTATFKVDAVNPDAIVLSAELPIQLQDLPITASYVLGVCPICTTISATVDLGVGAVPSGGSSCGGSNGTPEITYQTVPLTVTLPLVADTIAPRIGYTKIDAANIKVNLDVTSSDVQICCTGFLAGSVCSGFLGDIESLLFSTLESTVQTQITNAVEAQLCTKPTAGVCPAGSTPDASSGNCDYAGTTTCLPIELGTQGHLNLGSLLSSISYGTSSEVDMVLAAGGPMIPANVPTVAYADPPTTTPGSPVAATASDPSYTPNGVTLGLLGAMLPSPQSLCVPQAANPVPTGIRIPQAMEQNTESPWPASDPNGPDLGIALAGRYLNYVFGSLYNSGTLCLGVTTDSYQQLNTGLLSLLAPSMKDLTFEQAPAAAAVITRPQTPPTATIGGGTDPNTDPLLLISMKQFAIDFYVFSDDRYVRILTFTSDLSIPVSISTAVSASNPNGELLPVLGNVTAANAAVTNSELLLEQPSALATGLTGLVGGIVGQLTGSLKPISLASLTSSIGVNLTIPSGGIRKISQGTDDYVAIFADLGIAPASGIVKVHPQVSLLGKEVHAEAMALNSYSASKLPQLHVSFGTAEPAASPVEYSWWIDQGTRSAWSTATDVTIQNDTLFLQGKHQLYVSARVVDSPATEPETPAVVPFTIDVLPPNVTLSTNGAGASLTAWDFVSPTTALVARTRVTTPAGAPQAWTDWQPLASFATIPGGVGSIEAEVRDEEGNVATGSLDLIRGQNDVASAAGSCGCSTPGTHTGLGGGASLLVLFAGLALLVALRRARTPRPERSPAPLSMGPARAAAAVALGVTVVAGALNQGCSCGSNGGTAVDSGIPVEGGGHKADGGKDTGSDTMPPEYTCGANCKSPCMGALPQGIIGAYTSIAKSSTGTIWVAGYDDSAVSQAYLGLYGDLVVGQYDSAKNQVAWTTVDGAPAEPSGMCPNYDPNGWRGGVTDPGPDVGLWTSIQLDANDHPIVSYYDATNAALKFASSTNGTTWTSHTVMQKANSDIGRYGKMLVVNGVPVVAFLIMEPGTDGKMRSRVELGTATKATPASASDWTFEDAAVDDNGPCRAVFCASPSVCIQETGLCSPPSSACGGGGDAGDSGAAGCTSPLVCVGGFDAGASCGTPLASTYIDIYPNAFGDYITMSPTTGTSNGVGIVVYDRIHGALIQLAKWNSPWEETVLDSETGARAPNSGPDGGITPAETGDVGVGASLFITSGGDWHVSYVNGTTEALQYILVPGGHQQPAAPEIVDTGYLLNGAPYPDGQHIVGDDSNILVSSSGVVTISYQDATGGTLHVATGMPGSSASGPHTWDVVAATQPNLFAGFFSHSLPGDTQIENWWRQTDQATGDISGNVTFVSP